MADVEKLIAELRAGLETPGADAWPLRVKGYDLRALRDHIERVEKKAQDYHEDAQNYADIAKAQRERAEAAEAELARLRKPVEGEVGEVLKRLSREVHGSPDINGRPRMVPLNPDGAAAAELIQRLAGQVTERDAEISHMKLVAKNVDGLWAIDVEDKAAAEAWLLEAVEVLKPFAKAGAIKLCGEWKDHERFCQTDVGFYLHFGDLRRATAFLAKLKDQSNG